MKEMNVMDSTEHILESLYKDPSQVHMHAAQIYSAQG